MLSFASDYTEGACEEISGEAGGDEPGESAGIWHGPVLPECRQKKIQEATGCPEAEVYFLVGGTQTNAVDQQHSCTV